MSPGPSHGSERRASAPGCTRIGPAGPLAPLSAPELWAYRELLYFLVWRDVKVRYRQTALGLGWAVAQPVLTMLILSVFFGRLAGVPSDGLPYPLFALAGLVPWTLFSFALSNAAGSLVGHQHLLTKVYFPRLMIPTAAVLVGLVDFLLSLALLLLLAAAWGVSPGPALAAIPLLTALLVAAALGVGIGLAALNVRYRDVRFVLPFLSQLWLFVSPIAYPASLLEGGWRYVYGLNPMAGVVEGFRWALFPGRPLPADLLAMAVLSTVLLCAAGIAYFAAVERTFADVI